MSLMLPNTAQECGAPTEATFKFDSAAGCVGMSEALSARRTLCIYMQQLWMHPLDQELLGAQGLHIPASVRSNIPVD